MKRRHSQNFYAHTKLSVYCYDIFHEVFVNIRNHIMNMKYNQLNWQQKLSLTWQKENHTQVCSRLLAVKKYNDTFQSHLPWKEKEDNTHNRADKGENPPSADHSSQCWKDSNAHSKEHPQANTTEAAPLWTHQLLWEYEAHQDNNCTGHPSKESRK